MRCTDQIMGLEECAMEVIAFFMTKNRNYVYCPFSCASANYDKGQLLSCYCKALGRVPTSPCICLFKVCRNSRPAFYSGHHASNEGDLTVMIREFQQIALVLKSRRKNYLSTLRCNNAASFHGANFCVQNLATISAQELGHPTCNAYMWQGWRKKIWL